MFVLLTYDIALNDSGKRLGKVAKLCENYGVRVQNSVFEMDIDPALLIRLKSELGRVIDENFDSVRIYKLGRFNANQVEIMGIRERVELSRDSSLIL